MSTQPPQLSVVPKPVEDESPEAQTKEQILHILETTPYITRAMIQIGLGPGFSPKFWDPVLKALVDEGVIKTVDTVVSGASGRHLSKTIYHLPHYPYPPLRVQEVETE